MFFSFKCQYIAQCLNGPQAVHTYLKVEILRALSTFKKILLVCLTSFPSSGICLAQNVFPANGAVGIGTSSPANLLHVNGIMRWGGYNDYIFSGQDLGGAYLEQKGSTSATGKFRFQTSRSGDKTNYSQFYLDPNKGFSFLKLGSANGNVGIGTASPQENLHIDGGNTTPNIKLSRDRGYLQFGAGYDVNSIYSRNNSDGAKPLTFDIGGIERLRIDNSGNLGIGTLAPQQKLHIHGGDTTPYFRLSRDMGYIQFGAGLYFNAIYSRTNSDAPRPLIFDIGGIERLRIDDEGNLGIGSSDTKGYKLAVAGKMIAESVKVKLQGAWPDFVFQSSYQIPSLADLEKFIIENRRLPNIPSADEVENEGINLGEMDAKLLQKIEELTLHVIKQGKEIEELKRKLKK